ARFLPSARARKTIASVATSRASSSCGFLSLPSVVFHDQSRHGFELFPFKDKTFALIPAPCLLILARAAQPDFIRQLLAREGEQLSAKVLALILRRDKQLVEIKFGQMQCQH